MVNLKKDNYSNPNPFFTNKSNYSNMLDSYTNLVNQPTKLDAYADVFADQAKDMSSQGAMNQAAKGAMASFGAGLKGTANSQRQEKLSPYMQLTAQLTAKAAELEAQMQEEEGRKMTGIQFINSNLSLIDSLGNSTTAGDVPSATGQARALGDAFQKAFGIKLGEFDSYDLNTRRAYYKNEDGTVTGYNIADEIREHAQAALGDKAAFVMQKLDPYFKTQYENTEEANRLALEKERSTIGVNNSHAKLYNTQAKVAEHEMNAPKVDEYGEKLRFETLKDRAAKNYTSIEEKIIPRIKANENVLGVYEAFENMISDNAKVVGKDLKAQAWRSFATPFGLDADIDYANLKSVEFEKMLKPILGGQLGEKEGERLLGKFINLNMNPESIKKFLEEEKPRLIKEIVKDQQKVNHYNKESHGNLYDDSIHQNLEAESEKYLKERSGVLMIDPETGEQDYVPKNRVEEAKSDGLLVVK